MVYTRAFISISESQFPSDDDKVCKAVRLHWENTQKLPTLQKHTQRPGIKDNKAISFLTKVTLSGFMFGETR